MLILLLNANYIRSSSYIEEPGIQNEPWECLVDALSVTVAEFLIICILGSLETLAALFYKLGR